MLDDCASLKSIPVHPTSVYTFWSVWPTNDVQESVVCTPMHVYKTPYGSVFLLNLLIRVYPSSPFYSVYIQLLMWLDLRKADFYTQLQILRITYLKYHNLVSKTDAYMQFITIYAQLFIVYLCTNCQISIATLPATLFCHIAYTLDKHS